MKKIVSKKKNTKAVLIATSDDDVEVLRFLYDNGIMWGNYQIWVKSEKEIPSDVKPFVEHIPETKAISWLNSPKGFLPHSEKGVKIE